VSFAYITLCVASQRVFVVVYFIMTQYGNFWVQPRTSFQVVFAVSRVRPSVYDDSVPYS
jgi:hypothetical protein